MNNQNKKEMIEEIQGIIREYGDFSILEVEAGHSPIISNQLGNLSHLVERFDTETIDVYVYDDSDIIVDNYCIAYSELDIDTLNEIHCIVKQWSEINNTPEK